MPGRCALHHMNVPDGEFYQALGRVEGKIDQLLAGDSDKEQRLRVLERWRWKAIGAASVVSAVVAVIARLVMR